MSSGCVKCPRPRRFDSLLTRVGCFFLLAAAFAWSGNLAQAADGSQKYFSCTPEKRLIGQLKAIRLPAQMASEGDPSSYKGMFATDRLELVFHNRPYVLINLFEPFVFTAQGRTQHDGCKAFTFHFMNELVFFDYIHGTGNPYPAQQILVFDQNLKPLALPPAMDKTFRDSLNVKFHGDCISVVVESRAGLEFGCIRNRTYRVEKKTLFFSASGSKEYRVLCDIKT